MNLEDEVRKMALADGITDARLLETSVTLKRRDYYAATIRAYYQGRDEGMAAGLAEAAAPVILWVRVRTLLKAALRSSLFSAAVGATLAWVLIRVLGR